MTGFEHLVKAPLNQKWLVNISVSVLCLVSYMAV